MVISVSGTVGSGKSTAAEWIVEVLRRRQRDAVLLRFQALPCFSILRTPLKPPSTRTAADGTGRGEQEDAVRWAGYKLKRLGFATTAVYLARVLAFRLYRLGWRRGRVYVLNRYFYDLLTHYHLDSGAERLWLRLLRAAIPRPDLAIVLVADAGTLSARRPDYAPDFLGAASSAYARLHYQFPELVALKNDGSVDDLMLRLEQLLPSPGAPAKAPR